MKKFTLTALAITALSAFSTAQTISVQAAFAPNAFGSAQFDTWAANALTALQSGVNMAGTPGTSSYYENVTGLTFDSSENIVTNFQSWRGDAPGLYAPEFGTRMHFPVSIVSPTNTFSLSQVTFDMNSTNGNDLDFDGDLAGTTFGTRRLGVFYGGDGVLGGGDDVVYNTANPGSDTTLVNELYYVGIGNAFEALSTAGMTDQEVIDDVANEVGGYSLSTAYSVAGTNTGAFTSVNFTQPVPEPATMAALGLGALALIRRRRASR